MESYTVGTCEEMCPDSQTRMRTEQKLLHFYETNPPSSDDILVCISEFSRSAAGHRNPRSADLRTPATLRRTIDYLLDRVLLDERRPIWFAYEFVFDRLRCVRQEIVIQNLDSRTTIGLLEPIVNFLAYSSYTLCETPVEKFDPFVCRQHMQECLKKLLCCYDDVEGAETTEKRQEPKHRHHFEAMYLVFNLGSADAIRRGLSLRAELRRFDGHLVQICLDMSLCFYGRAYHRVLVLLRRLPALLAAVASLKVQIIRREMFAIFSAAYHSKVLAVPLKWLHTLLLYSGDDAKKHLLADLRHYKCVLNVGVDGVHFRRDLFDEQAEVIKPRHEEFVDELFVDDEHVIDTLLIKQLSDRAKI